MSCGSCLRPVAQVSYGFKATSPDATYVKTTATDHELGLSVKRAKWLRLLVTRQGTNLEIDVKTSSGKVLLKLRGESQDGAVGRPVDLWVGDEPLDNLRVQVSGQSWITFTALD